MPRPYNKLYTPSNSSTNYFANNVTGASLTLAQTLTPDGLAHRITVLNNTATDMSGKTITITGIGSEGVTQTEVLTGPEGSATVTSVYFYTSLTSVVFSSTISPDTVDVSYSSAFVSPAFPLDWRSGLPILSVILTGVGNYTVEFSDDLINQGATPPFNWLSNPGSPITNATTSAADGFEVIPVATRLKINSYSDGATFLFQISQKNF